VAFSSEGKMSKEIDRLKKEGKVTTVEQVLDAGPANPPPSRPSSSRWKNGGAPVSPPSTGTSAALAKMREQVPEHYISSLPKQTKREKEELEKDRTKGIRCALCHGWHHRDTIHVPYVGHAAVTDRLLESDPLWSWEPLAWTPEGLPRYDASGGMWIRLTVAGMTRLGYGHAAQKPNQDPGAREKEVIGDALRNAAMRFGVALDLWHKGELHPDGEGATDEVDDTPEQPDKTDGAPDGTFISDEQRDRIMNMAAAAGVEARTICSHYGIDALPQLHADQFDKVMSRLRTTIEKRSKEPIQSDILDDSVPY
jgi:hypothetical protein